jgi:glycosyltransferase involved in cell wall biosynthesis
MHNHNPKINVLLANDHLGWKGSHLHGVGRYFLNIIPNFSDRVNVVPCIMRKKDGLDKFFKRKNINVNYFSRTKFDPRTLLDFIRIIKRENINIMHLQGYAATTFGRIAGILCNVPTLLHQRDADPNHPGYMIFPDILLALGPGKGLAVSQYTKEFLAEKRKIQLDKIKALINPIDISKIISIDEEGLKAVKKTINCQPDMRFIGMITRFYPVKGVECLIKAAPGIIEKHQNVMFVLCGDGPLMDEMKKLATELNVEKHFLFPGFVDNPETWLSIFDVMVSCSYSEGCPNAILEAMALKRPIVCTKSGGPEEFLEDGYSALMPMPGDVDGIATSIMKILDDASLNKSLAVNARKAAEWYDVKNYLGRLEGIYNDAVNEHYGM